MDTGALSSLLWFIIIGGLFFFMMRMGGCGGHSHGGHGQHGGRSGGSKAGGTRDPVCGMEVEHADAALSREHMGETFYFCSKQCMDRFDSDPMAYMGKAAGGHRGHGG